MNKSLFNKLAIQNIKNNKNTFGPFAICTVTMVALFYMLASVSYQVSNNKFYGSAAMTTILYLGTWVCGIFSFFVILYTNNFLIKRRAKELGLYSMLGMDKKHIGKVVFWEMGNTGFCSILAGMVVGITFSKLIFMSLEKMLHLNTGIRFQIAAAPIMETLAVFVSVFILIMLINFIKVYRLKPIDLMRNTKVGEKEPKANWVLAIIGLICLGAGYYIAVTTTNPIKALEIFFVAVLLVIVGTYFIFVSGMVALLKLLKKNKNFYYKKKHFVTVSGLIYRMKQNAVGLANICILSTAVLVVLYSTVSLYIGTEEAIANRYPSDAEVSFIKYVGEEESFEDYNPEIIKKALEEHANTYNVEVSDDKYDFETIAVGSFKDGKFVAGGYVDASATMIYIIALEDYNRQYNKKVTLNEDEFLWYSSIGRSFDEYDLELPEGIMKMVGTIDEAEAMSDTQLLLDEFATMVVKDYETMEKVNASIGKNAQGMVTENFCYSFNLTGKTDDKIAFCESLRDKMLETKIPHLSTVDNIYTSRQDFINLYGSLFFIGIFIGFLFLITTVMIIYYKQISEGYDDREKFTIMRKVGMSDKEIKSTIRTQILTVFFIPIILAVVHVGFAFGVIRKIMLLFGITSLSLLLGCLVVTILVYLIVYGIAYSLTARSYYRCLM